MLAIAARGADGLVTATIPPRVECVPREPAVTLLAAARGSRRRDPSALWLRPWPRPRRRPRRQPHPGHTDPGHRAAPTSTATTLHWRPALRPTQHSSESTMLSARSGTPTPLPLPNDALLGTVQRSTSRIASIGTGRPLAMSATCNTPPARSTRRIRRTRCRPSPTSCRRSSSTSTARSSSTSPRWPDQVDRRTPVRRVAASSGGSANDR